MSRLGELKDIANMFKGDHVIVRSMCDSDVIDWAVEQAEKVEKLERDNKRLAEKMVTVLISNIELMDEAYPSWRVHAQDDINKLSILLENSSKNKAGG